MKKIIYGILTVIVTSCTAFAAEGISGSEIDLDSIRYNKNDNTAEIRMKIYNEDFEPGQNDMFYAVYYLKTDCSQRTYKPMIIEGYNRKDELIIVNYGPWQMRAINAGSDTEQAYNYACGIKTLPTSEKRAPF